MEERSTTMYEVEFADHPDTYVVLATSRAEALLTILTRELKSGVDFGHFTHVTVEESSHKLIL